MNDARLMLAIFVLAKYGARRWINRATGQMSAIFRRKKGGPRTATARKGRKGYLLFGAIVLTWLWAALGESSHLVHQLSDAIKGPQPPNAANTETRVEFLPSVADWPSADQLPAMVRAIGLVLAIAAGTILFLSLAAPAGSGGQAAWHELWLFSFPVRTKTIFLAKILQCALLNGYGYFFLAPLFFVVFWTAGYSWPAIPLAIGCTACLSILIASAKVSLETWLRLTVPSRLKDIQAFCSVAGGLGAIFIMFLVHASAPPRWFTDFAVSLGGPSLRFLPFGAAQMRLDQMGVWMAAACLVGVAGLAMFGSTYTAQHLVRNGLIVEPGPCHSRRKPAKKTAEKTARRRLIGGMAGKEIVLLLRDRPRLIGIMVLPLFAIAFNVFLHPAAMGSFQQDFTNASSLAFGIGTFIMLGSAYRILADEQKGLWLLGSLPKTLDRILLQKSRVWISVGLFYPVVVLLAAAVLNPNRSLGNVADAFFALIGVVIYSFIAAGVGFLGTDALEPEPARAQRFSYIYLYMVLATMYAPAIYGPSIWIRIGQVVFSALLAVAIWQKVRDSAPFLLDPTQSPAASIGVSDGMIAAFAFLSIQGVVLSFFAGAKQIELAPDVQLLIGYLVAGLVVTAGSLYAFHRRKVPRVLQTVGVLRGRRSVTVWKGLALGTVWGSGAALFGCGYLWLLQTLPVLRTCMQPASPLSSLSTEQAKSCVIVLVILAAPLLEEYVFRGLLLQGLLRTLPRWVSIGGSAALFALIHPPVSVIPVFVLGIATGVVYARTRWLMPSIAVHVVYNAAIITANLLIT